MSKFTQQEETDIVYDAFMLQSALEEQQSIIDRILSLDCPLIRPVPPSLPERPVRKIAPDIIPTGDFNVYLPERADENFRFIDYIKKCKYPIVLLVAYILMILINVSKAGYTHEAAQYAMTLGFLIIGFPFFCIALLIISYGFYRSYKVRLAEKINADSSYRDAIFAAQQDAQRRYNEAQEQAVCRKKELQDLYDKDYEEALSLYHQNLNKYHMEEDKYKVLTGVYNEATKTWNNKKNEALKYMQSEINYTQDALNNLYETTRIISQTYRETWILKWLYNDMASSDHEIRYATELLDRDRQRCATEKVGNVVASSINMLHSDLNEGLSFVIESINDNNRTLDQGLHFISGQINEINDNVVSAKKRNDLYNIIAIYQRWAAKKQ